MTFNEIKELYLILPPPSSRDKKVRVFAKKDLRFVGHAPTMAAATAIAELDAIARAEVHDA